MRYLKYLLWGGNSPEKEAPNSTTIVTGTNGAITIVGGAPSVVAPGVSGNILTSNGTIWQSAAASGGSGSGSTIPDYISYTYFGGF